MCRIPDETATKPDDWDEDAPETIIDESATMPSDWREDLQELIPDPDAEKPQDWDDEMDGTWEAALISESCYSNPTLQISYLGHLTKNTLHPLIHLFPVLSSFKLYKKISRVPAFSFQHRFHPLPFSFPCFCS